MTILEQVFLHLQLCLHTFTLIIILELIKLLFFISWRCNNSGSTNDWTILSHGFSQVNADSRVAPLQLNKSIKLSKFGFFLGGSSSQTLWISVDADQYVCSWQSSDQKMTLVMNRCIVTCLCCHLVVILYFCIHSEFLSSWFKTHLPV